MILISHRGNINGPNPLEENKPEFIDFAISAGYDVEIDLWCNDDGLYLGHDRPDTKIDLEWLSDRKDSLWIHCKNIRSLLFLRNNEKKLKFFWHQSDDVALTSNGFFWTFPGKELTPNSIACLPELSNYDDINNCFGICSDYVMNYSIQKN
jgi:hypothetical protein